MSITHVPDEELLVFDHEIAAPVEDVFGAYLDPELLVRWYGPAGWHVRPTDVVVEPVVGGMQRLSMINEVDPSVSCILQSRFLSIEPLKELEYAAQLPAHAESSKTRRASYLRFLRHTKAPRLAFCRQRGACVYCLKLCRG